MRWVHLILIVALAFNGAACKKKKKDTKAPVATPTTTPIKERPNTNTTPTNTTNTTNNTTPTKTDKPGEATSSFGPIYFSYDSPDLSAEAKATLDQLAEYLEKNPNLKILISGHADERGTEEYNLSLGEDRAKVARDYLLRWKISANRIKTLSYGEEKPAVQGDEEGSWAQNRRDEFELSE